MRSYKWALALILGFGALGVGGAAAQTDGPPVSIDAVGMIEPGSSVQVSVSVSGEHAYAYVFQCRTGTDICDFRTSVELVDGVGSAEVTVRRVLVTYAGRANCSRVACELRVDGDGGVLGAAAIEVDPDTVISRPVVTVEPAVDLVDRSTVEISGSGYESDSYVEFYQCTLVSCATQSASMSVGADGELRNPAEFRVQREVGGLDCVEFSCFVLAVVNRNGDALSGALLTFDPAVAPVPPAVVNASPTRDLLHGQLISVSGTGFDPDEYVRIEQCVGEVDALLRCSDNDYQRADADGDFLFDVSARRRVASLDCAVERCTLRVTGRFDHVLIRLSYDDSVPPPPLPTASASPSTALVDHQVVTVTVDDAELGAYVSASQCLADTFQCRSSINSEITEQPWTGQMTVVRDIAGNDCALVDCELVIQLYGSDSTRLAVPIGFDPDGPRADPPALRVLPATGLWDGQRVELRVDNGLPGEYRFFAQCPPDATSPQACGERHYSFDDAQQGYAVQRTLRVWEGEGVFTEFDCGALACELVMFDPSDQRLDAVALSFVSGGASSGGYPVQLECVAWPTDSWPTGAAPTGVDPGELQAEIDQMLASDTDAVVVIHGGRLVGEGYDRAMSVDSINRSFSVSKTFVGTVIGMLVDEGLLELDAPAPVPEWSDPDDPRHQITLRHLMNMAPGLEWDESYSFDVESDIIQMLLTPDSASYVADKPLVEDPGTRFNYSTGTTQILARIISDTLDKRDDDLRTELDARLFDVLGQTEDIPVDPTGVWRGGGWTDMSTRDFARLGLLHLRGGVWEDEQLVSREWMEFMHEASPASSGYAGQMWRRGGFVEMVGLYGQKVTIRPDLDLVVASNTPATDGGAGTNGIVALFESVAPASCSDEPVLVGDEVATSATVSVSVDVLANDPGRGSALRADTLTVYDLPLNGSAEIVAGEVVYTPAVGFSGVERFSYLVCTDAPYCGTAEIRVDVDPWGMSLRHADAVVMGSVLQLRVRAAGAPVGADLDPVAASVVEIDCETAEVIGVAEVADYRTTHPSGLTYVRWTTDDDWDGCRRLQLTFADGTELGADVVMLVPIP